MTVLKRIALAQLNFTVGDLSGNLQKHIDAAKKARSADADLIIFPELSLSAYPPEDLLFSHSFLNQVEHTFQTLLSSVKDIYCIVGYPKLINGQCYNYCSLIYNGAVLANYAKQRLPNQGVFDEQRYFTQGQTTTVATINNTACGIMICEDIWHHQTFNQTIALSPQVVFVINASPFEIDKHEKRVALLSTHAKKNHVPIAYVNLVGGQDELIFDGGSMMINATGEISAQAAFFEEDLLIVNMETLKAAVKQPVLKNNNKDALNQKIYQALSLGLKDYVEKNHFPGVLIGVSGGIDSALTLAIAVDALGKERVQAIFMPSRFTSQMSHEDALSLTQHLNLPLTTLSIEDAYKANLHILSDVSNLAHSDLTKQNIQARCRMILLMALSNESGFLVLSTSNRSELAMGFGTLYGDLAGGFGLLKDISKGMVYDLANYRNQSYPIIPERILTRAPSAELAHHQRDDDTLPPYPVLDAILSAYIDKQLSIADMIKDGFEPELLTKVISSIRKTEYKRRQAPIGPRIHHYAFGKDRRFPITNGFTEE